MFYTAERGWRHIPHHAESPFVLSVGPSLKKTGRSRRTVRFDSVRFAHYAQRERFFERHIHSRCDSLNVQRGSPARRLLHLFALSAFIRVHPRSSASIR